MDSTTIENLPITKTIKDAQSEVEFTFLLEKEKIHVFQEYYLPKWKNNKPYFLVSQKCWGIHQKILLYCDHSGTDFFVDYNK
jgi:hypothetical protein